MTREEEGEEESIQLSAESMAALQAFYTEQETLQTRFESLKAELNGGSRQLISMDMFTEGDFRMIFRLFHLD